MPINIEDSEALQVLGVQANTLYDASDCAMMDDSAALLAMAGPSCTVDSWCRR